MTFYWGKQSVPPVSNGQHAMHHTFSELPITRETARRIFRQSKYVVKLDKVVYMLERNGLSWLRKVMPKVYCYGQDLKSIPLVESASQSHLSPPVRGDRAMLALHPALPI